MSRTEITERTCQALPGDARICRTMSRKLKYLLVFVLALIASVAAGWSMAPGNTPLHGLITGALGESGVRVLHTIFVTAAVMIGFQMFGIWPNRTSVKARSKSWRR